MVHWKKKCLSWDFCTLATMSYRPKIKQQKMWFCGSQLQLSIKAFSEVAGASIPTAVRRHMKGKISKTLHSKSETLWERNGPYSTKLKFIVHCYFRFGLFAIFNERDSWEETGNEGKGKWDRCVILESKSCLLHRSHCSFICVCV